MVLPKSTMLALLSLLSAVLINLATAATGTSTHYWDCCMPSCAWPSIAPVSQPVSICDVNDQLFFKANPQSACVDVPSQHRRNPAQSAWGDAFACRNTMPYAKSDQLAYGFAAVKIAWKSAADTCCSCYHLTFTSTPLAGKQIIVQATNTGSDLTDNQFDIMMPGGGVGAFGTHACARLWGSIDFGDQYGGFKRREMCDQLPPAWRDGCYFRFDWYRDVGNPAVEWNETECPSELTAVTGCRRL